MKESLAERQAALLRQNAALDEQVEAIEQRRQLQQAQAQSVRTSSSASLASEHRGTKKKKRAADAASARPIAHGDPVSDAESNDLEVVAPLPSSSSSRSRVNIPMDLSASIDSFSAASRGDEEAAENSKRTTKSSKPGKRAQKDSVEESKLCVSDSKSPASRGGADERNEPGEGMGLEATVRYQKARLRVLQDEVDGASTLIKELEAAQTTLQDELDAAKTETATLTKKHQQTQQLLDKQRELTAALESKQRILEGQLSAAQTQVEELQRAEKQAAQQFRSKDVRLNRALEELEKVKAQLQEEKRSSGQATVGKDQFDQLVRENKKLDKQKSELLAAFKKQMKLIDLLKRQRIHMEAAKMLSFTEEEFSKTLELG